MLFKKIVIIIKHIKNIQWLCYSKPKFLEMKTFVFGSSRWGGGVHLATAPPPGQKTNSSFKGNGADGSGRLLESCQEPKKKKNESGRQPSWGPHVLTGMFLEDAWLLGVLEAWDFWMVSFAGGVRDLKRCWAVFGSFWVICGP